METQLAHLHVVLNHLPIIGSILGTLVLIYGIFSKSRHTKIAAYGLLIISALGAAVTYATGEPAKEIIENIAGISRNAIELHKEAAQISLFTMFILGVSSLAGLYASYFKKSYAKKIAMLTVIIGLISFVSISVTGYLGGKIRHTEFDANSVTQIESDQKYDNDDKY
jgi:uncharacterized membrane protein